VAKQVKEILNKLEKLGNKRNKAGMARFGIDTSNCFGCSVTNIRALARKIEPSHDLALKLWQTQNHEAQILASIIDQPEKVTNKQLESWVKDIKSWDTCDQLCSNLIRKTKLAWPKINIWTKRKDEFTKRAGFVLMAVLATHDKQARDKEFINLFPIMHKHSTDERNMIKKAVNWALRGIGKRNKRLNKLAIKQAKAIKDQNDKTGNWIASDAIRELTSKKIQERLSN